MQRSAAQCRAAPLRHAAHHAARHALVTRVSRARASRLSSPPIMPVRRVVTTPRVRSTDRPTDRPTAPRRRARSLNRARGLWRWRWRWWPVTPRFTRTTRATCHGRHARAHARTCASSLRVARIITVSLPPLRTHARAAVAAALARSLDRAIGIWRWRWRWRSVKPCVTRINRVTYAACYSPACARITARACPHRFPSPRTHIRELRRRRRSLTRLPPPWRCAREDDDGMTWI